MFLPSLVDTFVTFASDSAAGNYFCWSRCPLVVISDSGRYFEMSFSVSPGHVVEDPSLIYWSRVILVWHQRI